MKMKSLVGSVLVAVLLLLIPPSGISATSPKTRSVKQTKQTKPTKKSTNFYKNVDNHPRDKFVTTAKNGIVSAAHPLASQAGIDVLKAGGNAIDAFVAASFAISVLRPQSTGIGGGGFLLYYDEKAKKTIVYDFRERAPLKATVDMYLDKKGEPKKAVYRGKYFGRASVDGHLAVGTPGLVAGVLKAHKKHGKLPLKTLMAAAIKYAEKGFPVYPGLARAINWRKSVLENYEDSARIFLPKGKPLEPGQILIQKDLAETLRLISKNGHKGFYEGKTKDLIVAEIKRGGGILDSKDFSTYKVKIRKTVAGYYRGHKIVSMPPPSSGGVHIIQILNMLSKDNVEKIGHNTIKGAHLLAEVMRRAYADRAKYLGDSDFVKVPIKGLLSKKYAAKLRKTVDLNKASISKEIKNTDPLAYESSSTTHISIVDKWGNGASSTQTINYGFGSGVIAQGTGLFLNDEMDDFSIKPGVANAYGLVGSAANAVAAKKTMLSSMSPTLVFDDKGHLKIVAGSPGGPRIITATLQTIINVIDHKMSLVDAVHAARIHHQWLPDEIRVESSGLNANVVKGLEKLGHKIVEKSGAIGAVEAIQRQGNGWIGVSDSRSDGRPLGY